jgi:hypothetical protein
VLFGWVNSQLWRTKGLTSAGLHLNKNQNAPVAGDDVNFSKGAAVIAAEDAIAQALKVAGSKLLAYTPLC